MVVNDTPEFTRRQIGFVSQKHMFFRPIPPRNNRTILAFVLSSVALAKEEALAKQAVKELPQLYPFSCTASSRIIDYRLTEETTSIDFWPQASPAFGQGFADFPMVSERINDSSYAPTVLIADWPNHSGARRYSPFESGIRIFHGHHHPHRTTAESLGAEVQMLRRFVGQPEFAAAHGQPGDDFTAWALDAEQLVGSKRRLVELDRPHPISNREQGRDSGLLILNSLRVRTHQKYPPSLISIAAAR
jgi:hypothetical protein